MLTINLLQALPKTPLWDRLKGAGRIDENPQRESNVRTRLSEYLRFGLEAGIFYQT